MNCPLCVSPGAKLLKKLDPAEIVLQWKKQTKVDVRPELTGVSAIDYYSCRTCSLGFFKPDTACGSPALYEQLEKLDTYYLPHKWEHDVALQDMNGATSGLEIGCGFGAFVSRVIREKKISFEGCEANPSAVRAGKASGVPIRLSTLAALASETNCKYDVVCAFQVLEHVVEPRSFLELACSLIKPGGKLILALPNANSFVKHAFNVYQFPPHHMTAWSEAVLQKLPAYFPLKTIRIMPEPLAAYQAEWYIGAYESLIRRWGLGFLVHPWVRSRAINLLRRSRLKGLLPGEAVYACYQRGNS
jgi:SAM-dependent methyltransferase